MKPTTLLLAFSTAIILSSCTTAYKTGQTPDDVYFSPARQHDEYVRTDNNENNKYRTDDEYYDDRYLRMKVHNHNRWSDPDESYYYDKRYYATVYTGGICNNPWSPYTYWNNYYNPYYHNYVILSPKSPTYNGPRTFNLNSYNNTQTIKQRFSIANPNYKYGTNNNTYSAPRSGSSTRDNGNSGNFLRDIFSSGGSKSNSSSNSSGNSTNNSSGSSGNSSHPAPVRKF